MARTATAPRTVKVDGSPLSAVIDGALESLLVVDRLAMPDMFALTFRDPGHSILHDAGLDIGTGVEISTASLHSDRPAVLIDGEVTSIEVDYDTLGSRAIVRGYDRSHRLAAGRRTATFEEMSYSEIAKKIAQDTGLEAEVEDSGASHEHVLQANLSDLDFLYGLARRVGFDCRVEGRKLFFGRPVEASSGPDTGDFTSQDDLKLVWGKNLLDFRARMSAVAQVAEVRVRGWDPVAKKAVVGRADVTATNAKASLSVAQLAARMNSKTLLVVDHPVTSQGAADGLATARAQGAGSAAFEATAVAVGSPALRAGTAVSVSGIDPALKGKWVITGSRHEITHGTYRTALEFTGRQDRSTHGLLAQGAGARERNYGVVVGLVTEIKDPRKMARVKVSFPWLGDEAVSSWARLAAPGAGKDSGVMWMPQVGDEVIVAFEHGDIDFPVVLGGLWNGEDTVPFDYGKGVDEGRVTSCGFTSRTGHTVSFVESKDESKILLVTAKKKMSVVLDERNETIEVESSGKLTVKAQGDVAIKAGGSLTLEASGQVKIKGATVALN